MRAVARNELMALGDYDEVRPRYLSRIIERKKRRRLGVGDHMTLIFENRDTVLFQIQEMLRTERITEEKAIHHELETYNSMVPGEGELFATLMIEYEDPAERKRMLAALAGLKDHLALVIGEASAPGQFELLPGEEEDRLPAVSYVRFRVGTEAAAALRDPAAVAELRVDHPAYQATAALPGALREELAGDLEEP